MDFLRNIPCWIWPLLSGLFCGILGYYLGRSSKDGDSSENNYKLKLEVCKRKTASLEADLNACRSKLKSAPVAASTTASMANSFAAGAATTKPSSSQRTRIIAVPFDTAAAKAAFGKKKVRENDLTIVEGIGPKISELFHNHDIKTWEALAGTSVDTCQEVLNTGGKRYEIHRPGTWPQQAEMAAKGKWSELKKWQDEHDYGKA